jgi:SAM-dependent methyltransferase
MPEKPDKTIDPGVQEATYDRDAMAFKEKSQQLSTWVYIGGPEIDRFAQGIPDKKRAKVLDQGSASGRVVKRLIENGIKPENIIGVEISPDQVQIARKEIPQTKFVVGNLATVELEANSMDAATQHMVGEHLDDETLAAVNKHTFEILKPGGKYLVVLTHPSKTAITSGLTESGSFMTTFPWGGEGLNYHRTREDLIESYKRAGFVIDSVKDLKMPEEAEETHPEDYQKYQKYPYIRISLEMHKPGLVN